MIDWYCDSCNSYINDQVGFTDNKRLWVCDNCGHVNELTKENILNSKVDYQQSTDNQCISCHKDMTGSEYTAKWEDGDNSSAYITCKHCGCYNFE